MVFLNATAVEALASTVEEICRWGLVEVRVPMSLSPQLNSMLLGALALALTLS